MNATIEKVDDIEELSQFLSKINKQRYRHIGYCGVKEEEICQTLKEDFISDNGDIKFLIARSSTGQILAAIGLDIEETSAEVWGPFNITPSDCLQFQLWKQLLKEISSVQEFYFFINNENKQQQAFMNKIEAKKTGEHLILEIKEQNFQKVIQMNSESFKQDDLQAFEKLHNSTFPNTYYDARTIIKRLNNSNMLKVIKTKANELQGYAYFEIDTDMAEASLEYVAISKKAQNQGLGTMLLNEVLTEIFSYPQIDQIKLTVDKTNSKANRVYMKVGFEPKDTLISYFLKLQR
ncbi:ribosomal protein S18 acetylase RimI-like enzyme [Pullulanibacillus pueri]|uniref:N-acetyltransferase n=1 Tax=Pullulanibacillus pueri TaxID=1437324 RepID=A0A8J2ZTF9_9BACL|nr:N-acetyltransferase [Pullulanibacillus pueri]MBM7681193.1 ribosomal protein S18 acetylase RimI-like enzyme [Pullulanibacillus pueri]GGH77413.1 N-acetyltransferase [Pullulanibacillus pueri]